MVVAKTASCGIFLAFVGHPFDDVSRNQISGQGFQSKLWSHPCSPWACAAPYRGLPRAICGKLPDLEGHFEKPCLGSWFWDGFNDLHFHAMTAWGSATARIGGEGVKPWQGSMVGEDIKKPKTMVVINALVTSCYIHRESFALFVHFIYTSLNICTYTPIQVQ